jgi:sarcosine oxidase subunit delta
MRIACPHCGTRDGREFTYLGDAGKMRPGGLGAGADEMFTYVYLRDNPAGPHRELWYHAAGCHAWLVVMRDTRTHEIADVRPARNPASAAPSGAAS